jgi:general secretion pathway protein D
MTVAHRVKLFAVFAAAALLAGCSGGFRQADSDPLDLLPGAGQADPARERAGSELITGSEEVAPLEEQVVEGQAPRVRIPNAQASRLPSGAYSVNFVDARADEAAQTIFGDLLEEPYLIDPRVQGRITVSTPRPLSREGLLALFEAALAMNNASLVNADGVYRIVPANEAVTSGLASLGAVSQPGWGLSVLPLEHVSATNMRQLLETVVTRPGALRADVARNMLLVVGTSGERRNAAEAVEAFDVDWMAGMSVGLIPLMNASADSVVEELGVILQTEDGGALQGAVRLQPVERLNAVLAITASPALLDQVREWTARLDTGGASGVTLRTYFLENGKAEETAALLNQLFDPTAPLPTGVAPDLESRSSGGGSVPTSSGGGSVRVIADPINNAILVMAPASGQILVERALRSIDRAPSQVLIDAVIAEVTLNDTLRYGVQFFWDTNGVEGIADSGRGGFGTGSDFDANGIFPGFNFILESGDNARVALDALSSITDLTVVSSPSVMVLDNQTAEFQVGDEVPIVTRQSTGVVNPDSPVVNSIEFRDTGVLLNVTPRVSSTGLVTLEVQQEVSNVARSSASGTLTPTISTRRISSTVSVRSGQTIILGGLIDEERDNARDGLPLVSRIPVIGDALSSTEQVTRRTELLIFLTPRVISNDEEAAAVTQEFRRRMDLLNPEPSGNE